MKITPEFFTPMYSDALPQPMQFAESYWDLGANKVYKVKSISYGEISLEKVDRETPASNLVTALKVASWATVILPLIFLTIKVIYRSFYRYFMDEPIVLPQVPSRPVYSKEIPSAPEGVIENGYGEYVVYRAKGGKREAATEAEFDQAYAIFEECRPFKEQLKHAEDRYKYLRERIKKIDADLDIAFIPRTLYEMVFLRKCVQEDLKRNELSYAANVGIQPGDDPEAKLNDMQDEECRRIRQLPTAQCRDIAPWEDAPQDVTDAEAEQYRREKIAQIRARRHPFWQICHFNAEHPGNSQSPHVKDLAFRLNQAILKRFQNEAGLGGFSFDQIAKISKELITYLRDVHVDSNSDLSKKVARLTHHSTKGVTTSLSKIKNDGTPIDEYGVYLPFHEEILEKMVKLECGPLAVGRVILTRGSQIHKDDVVKEDHCHSLSYGMGLFAAAENDPGATVFRYMRFFDAHALAIPLNEIADSPLYIPEDPPLVQQALQGEYFHARTKVWKTTKISGISTDDDYDKLPDPIKWEDTEEELKESYRSLKEKTILLHEKEVS